MSVHGQVRAEIGERSMSTGIGKLPAGFQPRWRDLPYLAVLFARPLARPIPFVLGPLAQAGVVCI